MNETDFTNLSEKIWAASGRREDLVARVANALREQILSGQLVPGAKLVPEAELAKHLGISRPSLREAIRILAREGLILVKHGVGTFVSKDTKPMLGSLELMRSMTDLIRAAGGEPSYRDLVITQIEPSTSTAGELEIDADAQVGLISRVRLIDDTPFVVAKEYVVLDDYRRNFEALSKFEGGSLYAFLRQDFGVTVSHSKARISAVAADGHMAQVLGLRKGAPLLLMHEIHYGFDGKPVLLAINYHNTEVVEFTSMRSGAPV
ncbi:MAG: transcriptional regulator [Devosia sp.]|uniref:GntR family transcriptional regulator n=1 Tax=Devosia sp. TaxID=1871048 RepID=UPI002602D96D|nr:GntR family transcriptional regulator [Devosia sp.]MDB5536516.1 transcriptional regulator [Devosia sp.]MDB5586274.1 transcriptional regulator [Devosia sp.]